MTQQQLFSEEIRNASGEHDRGHPADQKKGTRKKSKPKVLIDFFSTVCLGTSIRRKDEIQHCCFRDKDGGICGEVTFWKGYLTGHTGTHSRFGGSELG